MIMKKNFSQLIAATAIVMASLASPPAAMAHGAAEHAHGGVVQTASDLSFELVATADGAAIYIVDHDEDADASKFGGKITVLNGTEKAEAPLKSAGGNKLEAKGVKLGKGAKAVAALQTADKKTVTVRFTVK